MQELWLVPGGSLGSFSFQPSRESAFVQATRPGEGYPPALARHEASALTPRVRSNLANVGRTQSH